MSLNRCPLHILMPSMIYNCTEHLRATWNLFVLFDKKKQKLLMVTSPVHFPPMDHNFLKEPIKIHVEFSKLYKTLLMVEMRSKIFKEAEYKF